jgi:hypothetical protein
MLYSAAERARSAGVPFALVAADIHLPDTCEVLGIALRRNNKKGPIDSSPTLDRIVPELGYVPGNVVVISHRANRIKNDATAEELRRVLAYVDRRHGR